MNAFSTDLRRRAIAAYDANEGTQRQVADRFQVGVSRLRNVLRPRRMAGSIDPRPHGGGRTRVIDDEAARRLRRAVAEAAGVRASPLDGPPGVEGVGRHSKKSPGGRPSRIGLS